MSDDVFISLTETESGAVLYVLGSCLSGGFDGSSTAVYRALREAVEVPSLTHAAEAPDFELYRIPKVTPVVE